MELGMNFEIDLNADLGEFDNSEALDRDCAIMAQISSANIACGGHAGNDHSMRLMLEACLENRVAAGAHPSYPDKANFGRVSMTLDEDVLLASLIDQIELLKVHAQKAKVSLMHVKPHGQLYNDAADSLPLARLIATAISKTLPEASYVGLSGSEMAIAAQESGLHFVAEGFADRRYNARGRLVSRKESDAVLENSEERISQALALAKGEPIHSREGTLIDLSVGSICLHSDSDGALATARDIRTALDKTGIMVRAPR